MSFTNVRLFRQGTWADLYLAERSDSGRSVIIKILREAHDAWAKRTFLRELRIVTRSIHKRVVRAISGDATGERPYYVMDFCPHGAITPYAGKLESAQLRAVALQLCEGIAAMHSQGIIHGDIKPDNLMIAADGNVQICDPLGNGTGCTVTFSENSGGTPGYWAPELAGGRGPISMPGDCFSIGATLYHLATGVRPVDGQDMDTGSASAKIADDIGAVILAACRMAPDARPTVAQLLKALKGDLSALAPRPAQRRDVGGALLTVGGVVLGVVLLAALLSKGK